MKRELIAVMFLFGGSIGYAHAWEQQQAMLEKTVLLAKTAPKATITAEKGPRRTVGTAANVANSSSNSVSDGLQAASRILKNPNTYSGEDALGFVPWRFQFMSWLTCGDPMFIQVLKAIEAENAMPTMIDYNEAQTGMSHKLYAVLTDYLRGCCARLAQAHAKTRNGFAVWYNLMKEF